MSTCLMCNKKAKSSDCVTCDICRKNVHTECAGLSRLETECIRSSSRKVHYYCEKCDIVSTMNSLKSEIDVLKSELLEIKKRQDQAIDHDSDKRLSEDEVIAEVEDRNRRAANLILFNLPESTETLSDQRKEDDTSRCLSIVLPTNKDNVSVLSCLRMGKYNSDKLRPLKMTFANAQQALDVLKSYKRKDNFYLNRDLTPRQQNSSYLIRSEFKRRKQQGEHDIQLRYYNGMPKIIVPKNM